ncbi:MAG: hypothetical protein H6R10_3321 [Rhodocyclaceae bacterium]|nr:hypothetical protein [Rhodocyclaceae bacterium]
MPDSDQPTPPRRAEELLGIAAALARELRPGSAARRYALDDSLDRGFGLDSLARVELVRRIEQAFGVRLAEDAFATAETLRDLLGLVERAQPAEGMPASAATTALPESEAADSPPDSIPTLVEALDWHADRHGGRLAVRLYADGEAPRNLTYGDLRADALGAAAGLMAQGAVPGDRIAIMLPTSRGFLSAFYGALYAGCIPVPLYPPARMSQIEDHLRRIAGVVGNAGARLLVTVDRAKPLVPLLRAGAPDLQRVVTPGDLAGHGPAVPAGSQASDIAFLQYTSGSTGNPKGVVLTHANLLANIRAMAAATRIDTSDIAVSWLPLYHDMGLIGAVLGSMVMGARLVLLSPLAFLSRPERWLRAIHEHRGTLSAAPNFAYELCAGKIQDADLAGLDLSSWRIAFNGAEPVAATTLERFAARFAPYGFDPRAMTPVYGLAESSVGLAFPPPGRGPRVDRIDRQALIDRGEAIPDPAGELAVVAAGVPLPGHEIRVVDGGGRESPDRTQGRVQFRGPSATSGYYGNAAATAALFDNGWLNTGDLGYLAGGELFVTGREKDIIIRGGHNIHPQELEEAVGRLAGVRKGGVAVFPASDPGLGTEKLVVLAETLLAAESERAALAAEISRRAEELTGGPADDVVLAPPRTVLKTSSGKIRRAACRAGYENGELLRPRPPPWRQFLRLGWEAVSAGARRSARRLAEGAFAARAWGAVLLVAVAACPLIVVLPGLGARRRLARGAARLALALAGLSPRREGQLPAGAGGGIYVANHASYLDAIVLTAALPPEVAFVGKRELGAVFGIGLLLRRQGTFLVDREDAARGVAMTEELVGRARAGASLVFFAEGGFTRAPGLGAFRHGAFVVAARSGRPVVPVTLTGTRAVLPGERWQPRRRPITVWLGAPLAPSGEGWEAVVALRGATRRAILARLDEPDLAPG